MAGVDIFAERASFSRIRIEELRNRLNARQETKQFEDLAIFCAGSYAREEASKYSDIDLFFIYSAGAQHGVRSSKISELRLFSAVIDIAEAMGFPAFSNDGQYLYTLACDDVLEHMGSPKDDGLNHFTLRMLMLLESKCVVGDDTFSDVQQSIISAYYRDYPDHQASFEPWFLINDICRFWKTLLLNYEHKRNQDTGDIIQKNKQKVKNFKLKYSRMTTCFATVAALASLPAAPSEGQIYELVQKTPQQRLRSVGEAMPEVANRVENVLDQYAWFLEQTGQTEEQLRSGFEDKQRRVERFERANKYGDAMFDLLSSIGDAKQFGDRNRLLRYLVI
ncbi:nucleotidyltransferase domain-containing protein [Mycolicibacterium vaccae]|uniref:nucleotidyltransferase domain-containing protein n=1 Tax=Mycolicibacterium vaccae TaxID=1810 RepID=UPI003D0027E8